MPISWNEIRTRAIAFSKEFETETSEDAEAKTFWDAFFNVFGISRRRIASFEKPVIKSDGKGGYIDLLWKGTLLVEHKSRGKSLDRAFHQATEYFSGLKERDLPRYVLVSDFANVRLYDLETDQRQHFALKDLHKNIKLFAFIAGYQARRFEEREESANINAAEQLGKLHDQLKISGYEGHPLEVLLVRLLFCLFADDSGIFERNQFKDYLDQRTAEDGSDLGMHLAQLFQVLNTPYDKRPTTLDEQIASLAYVNGRLFAERLPIPPFNSAMRETLLDASRLDWGEISPAIFGSLFQSIMDKEARRNLGAHYTRELNILKALKPLFLDELQKEFDGLKRNSKRLVDFQRKLADIRIFDPACGCGNFLVIAYRELRLIELAVLHELYVAGQSSRALDVKSLVFVDVDQFYGIEIEEFPAQIAQVALWLTDHQMNQRVSEEFGQYFARLPLTKSPNIVQGNALRIPWEEVITPSELSYIVGNPPFSGAMVMGDAQRDDIAEVFHGVKGAGILDYVSAWYMKTARYLQNDDPRGRICCAFVSTNSITQGEQVGILWRPLLSAGVRIHFAHRTFQWSSEARGKAAVHCVIVGFGLSEVTPLRLFEYETPDGDPHEQLVPHINPYLVNGPDVLLENRSDPICDVPPMRFGSMPRDGGNLILSDAERIEMIRENKASSLYIKPYTGAQEFLNGETRWCLWLVDMQPNELDKMPLVRSRVGAVREFRLASKAASTKKFASTPTLFCQIAQPRGDYLLVPRVSSERRSYIPIGFVNQDVIANDQVLTIEGATLVHFGVLSSAMHMAWMRYTCGRLESRYRYSKDIVYNNFPWPESTGKHREAIEVAAQTVLDVRAKFPKTTLAELYDPLSMPPELSRAHQVLDKVVDVAFGKKEFSGEAERVAFLFSLYQKITAPLDVRTPAKKAGSRKRSN